MPAYQVSQFAYQGAGQFAYQSGYGMVHRAIIGGLFDRHDDYFVSYFI